MPRVKQQVFPVARSKKVKNQQTNIVGIYEILHVPSNRRYIGSSQEMQDRLYWHLVMLRKNKHHCRYLQNVWNKYGEEEFAFYLLTTCEISMLEELEQYYMDATKPGKLMNTHPAAGSGRGYSPSEETKHKMKVSAKRVSNAPGQHEYRSKRAIAMHAAGRITYRKKITKTRLCANCSCEFVVPRKTDGGFSGTKWCNNCRPPHHGGRYKTAVKLTPGVENQYHVKKKASEETKKKLSISHTGHKHSKQTIVKMSSSQRKRQAAIRKDKYNRALFGEGRPKQLYPGGVS